MKFSVQRMYPTNWRELSNTVLLFTEFFPQTDGNYPTLYFVHRIFPSNWRELSNIILCSPNFSHKLTGIIQHHTLFTEFFPPNRHDFPHTPTWIYQKIVLAGIRTFGLCLIWIYKSKTRAGNSLVGFLSESLIFCEKMSEWAICTKNERFAHSLIFDEWPEWFAHGCSFLVSALSELLMVAYFWWAT